MPIPEAEYGSWCADYYLVHLTTLLGSVISLEEVGAHYRLHGRNGFQPTRAHLDLTRLRREVHYQMVTMQALADLADKLAHEAWRADDAMTAPVAAHGGNDDLRPIGERYPWLVTPALLAAALVLGLIALRTIPRGAE